MSQRLENVSIVFRTNYIHGSKFWIQYFCNTDYCYLLKFAEMENEYSNILTRIEGSGPSGFGFDITGKKNIPFLLGQLIF